MGFRTTAGGMKLRQFYTLMVKAVAKNDNLGNNLLITIKTCSVLLNNVSLR